MKVTESDYNFLKKEISKTIERVGIEKIKLYKEQLKTDDTVKNLDVRFMFDLFWAIPSEDRRKVLTDEKNYNGNHLQTALKKVVKELNL